MRPSFFFFPTKGDVLDEKEKTDIEVVSLVAFCAAQARYQKVCRRLIAGWVVSVVALAAALAVVALV